MRLRRKSTHKRTLFLSYLVTFIISICRLDLVPAVRTATVALEPIVEALGVEDVVALEVDL
jgi:hypothetical protein